MFRIISSRRLRAITKELDRLKRENRVLINKPSATKDYDEFWDLFFTQFKLHAKTSRQIYRFTKEMLKALKGTHGANYKPFVKKIEESIRDNK